MSSIIPDTWGPWFVLALGCALVAVVVVGGGYVVWRLCRR